MNTYFSSDLHLNHENIIKYCSRPFKDKEHMNKEIIRRWNERVKEEDTVFHIGDFCFKASGTHIKAKDWEKQLNRRIIFLKGNHDRNNGTKTKIHRLVLSINGHVVNLVHDPIHADVNYEMNLTGHVHEKWEIKRIKKGFSFTDCVNVGVDVWDFYPVSYDEIKSRYDTLLKGI